MTIGGPSQCFMCKHFRSPFDRKTDRASVPTCDAYPTRIPLPILKMQVDHRQPQPGDHGIRWESNGSPYPEGSLIE